MQKMQMQRNAISERSCNAVVMQVNACECKKCKKRNAWAKTTRIFGQEPHLCHDYPTLGDSSLFGANAYYPFDPVRGGSAAIPTAGKISERPCMRLHAGQLRRSLAPAPLSEDARQPGGLACDPAPARGRVRRVGRCTLGLPRPQVRWPRVSRGGRLVTEVRRQRQSSSPPRPGN